MLTAQAVQLTVGPDTYQHDDVNDRARRALEMMGPGAVRDGMKSFEDYEGNRGNWNRCFIGSAGLDLEDPEVIYISRDNVYWSLAMLFDWSPGTLKMLCDEYLAKNQGEGNASDDREGNHTGELCVAGVGPGTGDGGDEGFWSHR